MDFRGYSGGDDPTGPRPYSDYAPGFRDAGFADPSRYLLPPTDSELATIRTGPGVEVVGERLVLQ